ncbi:hypothetical protein IFT67_19935 [Sphingomonas sp. CFBP 13728]|uniref:hypothetical protein n=1 Tax=Sphingomonas sp. CFBP 13728 TaxID=2775294 RepID=UPI001783BA4A|nr:hypothetical protein [Sphingomonas sp. CFBP 13728]MBD8621183.1 hypothetical protein [Sphingomonas sp. CFBP 13728]
MYRWGHHRVTLEDLIGVAWSAPMRELAAQIGLSDVGLKKLLKSHGVSGPPQGHWNRVHAGRAVSKPPAAPARGPGKRPYIHVDPRLARLPEAPLPSSAGPFASAKVPEDLEELRAQTLKAIGRPASAAKITLPHPAIRMLLAQDEKERAKAAEVQWHTANVLYDSPFEKRRLRILNALFLTLNRQGHDASSDRQDHHTEFRAIIGDTRIAVTLDEAGRKSGVHNRYTTPRPDPKRPASVKLRLTVRNASWEDDAAGTLESKIAEITAGLIVEGERAYRDHLRELEEQAERERIAAERRRQERLAKANAERSAALIESGRLLAEAENLRSLTARVAMAVADGRLDMSPAQLAEWRQWADQEADKLDPVISGQVQLHLLPPDCD